MLTGLIDWERRCTRSGFKILNQVKDQGGASGPTAGILDIFRGLGRWLQHRDLTLEEVLKPLLNKFICALVLVIFSRLGMRVVLCHEWCGYPIDF